MNTRSAILCRRCSKTARWVVRTDDDPATDSALCTVHADQTLRESRPASKVPILDP